MANRHLRPHGMEAYLVELHEPLADVETDNVAAEGGDRPVGVVQDGDGGLRSGQKKTRSRFFGGGG